jgi:hypothetical protein
MKKEYKEAFSEVDEIFDLMPSELLSKIPNKFKELIRNHKSDTYIPNIHEPFENCELKYETHIVLALIYRDFLCSPQEKQELLLRDAKRIQEFEIELREKYNPDNIFKNHPKESNDFDTAINNCTAMVEVKDKNFLQRFFAKIKNFFTRKN